MDRIVVRVSKEGGKGERESPAIALMAKGKVLSHPQQQANDGSPQILPADLKLHEY